MIPAARELLELLAAEIAEELLSPTPENEKTRAPTTASRAFSKEMNDGDSKRND
jgi:hypothetical protein